MKSSPVSSPPAPEEFSVPSVKKNASAAAPPSGPVGTTEPVSEQKSISARLTPYRRPALIGGTLLLLLFGSLYAFDSFTHEETDDAYVSGHLHDVSTRISGVVSRVVVDDNQFVKKGDVLVQLDADELQAVAAAAKANLDLAQADLDRLKSLIAIHAVAPEDVDKAVNTRDVDLAQYQLARLQIGYTTLDAPADGYIGRKSVEVGNRISSGQTLMVVVEPNVWVVANFKETQLAKMKAGQPAEISIDSLPGKTFQGRVESFSPATGNEFALLPADNSTGNFTKVVQRVPVKIVFDSQSTRDYQDRIRAGESAVVRISLDK